MLPVNFSFFEGAVVIRIDFGERLDHLASRPPATFQVDDLDMASRTGWSVMVQGTAEEVADPSELARVRAIGLRPWAPGDRDHYVRVLPSRITGRRMMRA
ncbi:pyridoxamine 5'-phosphate oxidase family protein [Egibacter rhizosphaerae]|uniref:pyridoxamine 5'-phosphate oxidase family protein n=1 Tax=Egibacter rhizosphaerae TaxID=1670831 RepID=UPI0013F171B6|nr:pyridoxamine 5'-phosphate oxidase family protein [Egibacter rhizosphaerae]